MWFINLPYINLIIRLAQHIIKKNLDLKKYVLKCFNNFEEREKGETIPFTSRMDPPMCVWYLQLEIYTHCSNGNLKLTKRKLKTSTRTLAIDRNKKKEAVTIKPCAQKKVSASSAFYLLAFASCKWPHRHRRVMFPKKSVLFLSECSVWDRLEVAGWRSSVQRLQRWVEQHART